MKRAHVEFLLELARGTDFSPMTQPHHADRETAENVSIRTAWLVELCHAWLAANRLGERE